MKPFLVKKVKGMTGDAEGDNQRPRLKTKRVNSPSLNQSVEISRVMTKGNCNAISKTHSLAISPPCIPYNSQWRGAVGH